MKSVGFDYCSAVDSAYYFIVLNTDPSSNPINQKRNYEI